MQCPHCGKPTSDASPRCVHCARPVAGAAPTRTEPVRCPRCGGTAEFAELGSLQVDVCRRCRGIWFDRSELEQLRTEARSPFAKEALERTLAQLEEGGTQPETTDGLIPCPLCLKHMNRKAYESFSGIVLDVCLVHGVWADRGEAREVLKYLGDPDWQEEVRRRHAGAEQLHRDMAARQTEREVERLQDDLEEERRRRRTHQAFGHPGEHGRHEHRDGGLVGGLIRLLFGG